MIIDIHTHTEFRSHDSLLSPEVLIARAKKAGLDGICITEHDCFWRREAIENLGREHNFLVMPGVELKTEDGHMLVYGIDEMDFGLPSTEHVREVADKVGGFMILPHPYRHNYLYGDMDQAIERCFEKPVFKLVDTIELINGRGTETENTFSRLLGKKLGLKGPGGSDAHEPGDMPTAVTKFERNIRNVEELIQELRAGRYEPVEMRKKSKAKSSWIDDW
jgi:predicted metal-dependent phosphoesterase TrpH